jgi:uncharacterized Zn finger protein
MVNQARHAHGSAARRARVVSHEPASSENRVESSRVTSLLANILHREVIARLADGPTFERGRRYHEEARVHGLIRRAGSLSAVVHGTAIYAVRIWVKDEALAYSCTCPIGQDGAFCKHAVAVALTWVETALSAPPPAPGESAILREIRARLDRVERADLVEMVVDEAGRNPRLLERLARDLLPRS